MRRAWFPLIVDAAIIAAVVAFARGLSDLIALIPYVMIRLHQQPALHRSLGTVIPPLGWLERWIAASFFRSTTSGIGALEEATDSEREGVVRRVMTEHRSEITGHFVGFGILIGMAAVPCVLAALLGASLISRRLGFAASGWAENAMIVFGIVLVCAAAFLLLRWIRRRYIRKLVRSSFERAGGCCSRCGYDLSSLREQGPVVTCPECGMANRFDSWTEGYAALIARKSAAHAPQGHGSDAPAPPATAPDPSPPRQSA